MADVPHDIGVPVEGAQARTWYRMVVQVLLAVALLVMAFYAVVYVVYALNLAAFPYDYDQGEGFELHDVMLFSQFEWPYADIETFPFYGSIYPPLYHILLVPFAWVFGPEYWYGRLFSFATTLVSASVIAWIVYRDATRRSAQADRRLMMTVAVLSGLAFLASPIVYHIGPLFRQHINMVMFEVLAVAVLAGVNEVERVRRRRRLLLLGFGLLIAGGYTKQLAAFTALGALVFVFIRNPRRGVIWGGGFALVGSAIFLLLTLATDGHWWTQTIVANVKDFNLTQARGLFDVFIDQHFWLLVPAGLVVLYELYLDRLSIYSLWFVATTALNAYAAGTWGAGDSYYATPVAAAAVLSGMFVARTVTGGWHLPGGPDDRLAALLRPAMPVLVGLAAFVPLLYLGYGRDVLHLPTDVPVFAEVADLLGIEDNTGYGYHDPDGYLTLAYAQIGHLTTQADREGGRRIVEWIESVPDDVPVLSEEAGFSFATGREVITNPVVLKILDESGAFDSSELVGMIEAQAFGMVILRARFYPPSVNRAITIYYEEVDRILMNGFEYIIKAPRTVPLSEDDLSGSTQKRSSLLTASFAYR